MRKSGYTSEKISGPHLRERLLAAGIPAQRVILKRGRFGTRQTYTADFYTPELEESVDPAQVWADRLRAAFPAQVQVLSTQDLVAGWRPGSPTIHASISFTFESG